METSDREELVQNDYPFKTTKIRVLSVLQIVTGCLCIAVNIALIVIHSLTIGLGCSTLGYGIWCGVFVSYQHNKQRDTVDVSFCPINGFELCALTQYIFMLL